MSDTQKFQPVRKFGCTIKYSKNYDCFQVWRNGKCLEEFGKPEDALEWAETFKKGNENNPKR